MQLILFLSLFTFSCVKQGSLSEFSSTDSPCLDAYIANVISAGCTAIDTSRVDENITHIKCQNYEKETKWTKGGFYIISNEIDIESQFIIPVCIDRFHILYFEVDPQAPTTF